MNTIPILMYHNIAKPPRGKRLSSLYTHPKLFARQMFLLSKLGFQGLSLKELAPYLKGEKSGKVFGITFDDGYLDNHTNALPVLQKLKFTATCYLVSGFLGKTNEWTRNQNVQECELMKVQDVESWLKAGMSIGSHSHTHAHLCKISSEQLEHEISHSKKILQEQFGIPINDFCFPYGEFNSETVEVLKRAGYYTAITTQRARSTKSDSLLMLPRVHMTKRTSLALLLLKIFTPYEDRRKKGPTL